MLPFRVCAVPRCAWWAMRRLTSRSPSIRRFRPESATTSKFVAAPFSTSTSYTREPTVSRLKFIERSVQTGLTPYTLTPHWVSFLVGSSFLVLSRSRHPFFCTSVVQISAVYSNPCGPVYSCSLVEVIMNYVAEVQSLWVFNLLKYECSWSCFSLESYG